MPAEFEPPTSDREIRVTGVNDAPDDADDRVRRLLVDADLAADRARAR